MGWSCLPGLGSSSSMEGQTDTQAPSPALPPRAELSSPARGGKLSADPNIAAAAARRSQNICGACQHEPAGLLCSAGAGIQQSRNRGRGEAAPPLPRTCGAPAAGGDAPAGGSVSQLTKATQASVPCPGTCQDP